MQHLTTVGMERIAVVHVTDSFGADALEGAINVLSRTTLRRVGRKPTRAKVLATLDNLRNYDMGGGMEISYSQQDHSGIDFADLSIISDGRFKR